MTCKRCDPTNETEHWNDYSHSTIAFVSYPSKYKDHAELVIRSLTREVGSQNITGSIDLRVPIEFCPFCGKDLTGEKEKPKLDRDGLLCERGDIVFGLGREQHRYKVLSEELDVEKCESYNHGRFTLPCLDLTEGDESVCFLDPRMVSHEEPKSFLNQNQVADHSILVDPSKFDSPHLMILGPPRNPNPEEDSFEKLRDDLKRKYGSNSTWVKRLTALMKQEG